MNRPLEDITVLDLSRFLAGPFCTRVLNDLGAEIIKIERPGVGDDARQYGPYVNDKSAYFASLNYGKKSVTLNLKSEEDRDNFMKLVEISDVLVENFRPGTMEKLNIDYEILKEVNPEIIFSSVSGFGQDGPYSQKPSMDMIVQACGGIMSITGEPEGKPVRVGVSIGDITAGIFNAVGILSALYQREKTGEGQRVDISMLDCQAAILENPIARYAATGEVPGPVGSRHPSITPYQAFETSDDWIVVAVGNNNIWRRFCRALEREDLREDTRFENNHKRSENHQELEKILQNEMIEYTTDELMEIFEEHDVPCTPINSVDDLWEDPQLEHRNMLLKMASQAMEGFMVAGNPVKMSSLKDRDEVPAPPELGEHTEEILNKIESSR